MVSKVKAVHRLRQGKPVRAQLENIVGGKSKAHEEQESILGDICGKGRKLLAINFNDYRKDGEEFGDDEGDKYEKEDKEKSEPSKAGEASSSGTTRKRKKEAVDASGTCDETDKSEVADEAASAPSQEAGDAENENPDIAYAPEIETPKDATQKVEESNKGD